MGRTCSKICYLWIVAQPPQVAQRLARDAEEARSRCDNIIHQCSATVEAGSSRKTQNKGGTFVGEAVACAVQQEGGRVAQQVYEDQGPQVLPNKACCAHQQAPGRHSTAADSKSVVWVKLLATTCSRTGKRFCKGHCTLQSLYSPSVLFVVSFKRSRQVLLGVCSGDFRHVCCTSPHLQGPACARLCYCQSKCDLWKSRVVSIGLLLTFQQGALETWRQELFQSACCIAGSLANASAACKLSPMLRSCWGRKLHDALYREKRMQMSSSRPSRVYEQKNRGIGASPTRRSPLHMPVQGKLRIFETLCLNVNPFPSYSLAPGWIGQVS